MTTAADLVEGTGDPVARPVGLSKEDAGVQAFLQEVEEKMETMSM